MKKTVLKVNIYCQKCKKEVLKAVTKLTGIDQVTIDGEKVTVVGDVDPVLITEAVRKIGKVAEIESVGPPKPPEHKSPVKNPHPPWCYDYCYCHLVPVSHAPYDSAPCSIL